MNDNALATIIALAIVVIILVVIVIIEIFNGTAKNFILTKMTEAEKMYPKNVDNYQNKRMTYVVEAVKERYKIVAIFVNVKKFVTFVCTLFRPKK